MPLWELAKNAKDLSISITANHAVTEEQDEAQVAAFELPIALPTNGGAVEAMHAAIVSRAVLAAVRGGHLTHLCARVEAPFAIRALLPHWISNRDWGSVNQAGPWLTAAMTLRRLLAHVSLWKRGIPREDVGKDRTLSLADIQSLNARYSGDNMPVLAAPSEDSEGQPVERYLPWLEQDVVLAHQVSEAWNAVVQRGEAAAQDCNCLMCIVGRLETHTGGPVAFPAALFGGLEALLGDAEEEEWETDEGEGNDDSDGEAS